MNQPAVDLLARVRAWWTERRARRDADKQWQREVAERNKAYDDKGWLDELSTPEDFANGLFEPMPGHRVPKPRPGDIPDQPAGGAG